MIKTILLTIFALLITSCAAYKTDEVTAIGIVRNITIRTENFTDSDVIAQIYSNPSQQGTIRSLFEGLFGVLEKAIPKITMGE